MGHKEQKWGAIHAATMGQWEAHIVLPQAAPASVEHKAPSHLEAVSPAISISYGNVLHVS